MIIFAIVAIILVLWGYVIYGRNLMRVESYSSAWPWVIFTMLAGNDFANYLFAEKSNWFEIFTGALIFIGPATISYLIISEGRKHGGGKNDWSKISTSEKAIFFVTFFAIVSITLIEILTEKGNIDLGKKAWVEYSFLFFAITLDGFALLGLFDEIKDNPNSFERKSWFVFLLAGISASIFDIWIGAEINSIALMLIFENNVVSICMLYFITKCKKGIKGVLYKSSAFYAGLLVFRLLSVFRALMKM